MPFLIFPTRMFGWNEDGRSFLVKFATKGWSKKKTLRGSGLPKWWPKKIPPKKFAQPQENRKIRLFGWFFFAQNLPFRFSVSLEDQIFMVKLAVKNHRLSVKLKNFLFQNIRIQTIIHTIRSDVIPLHISSSIKLITISIEYSIICRNIKFYLRYFDESMIPLRSSFEFGSSP